MFFARQDIEIKVHFWPDSQLRPVSFNHQLKLYPNENAAAAQQVRSKPQLFFAAISGPSFRHLRFLERVDRRCAPKRAVRNPPVATGQQASLDKAAGVPAGVQAAGRE